MKELFNNFKDNLKRCKAQEAERNRPRTPPINEVFQPVTQYRRAHRPRIDANNFELKLTNSYLYSSTKPIYAYSFF